MHIKKIVLSVLVLCILLIALFSVKWLMYFSGSNVIRKIATEKQSNRIEKIIFQHSYESIRKTVITHQETCSFFEKVLQSTSSNGGSSMTLRIENVEFFWKNGSAWQCGAVSMTPFEFSIIPEVFWGDEIAEFTTDFSTDIPPPVYDAILWFLQFGGNSISPHEIMEITDLNYNDGAKILQAVLDKNINYLIEIEFDKENFWSETLALQIALVRKDFDTVRILLEKGICISNGCPAFFIDEDTPADIALILKNNLTDSAYQDWQPLNAKPDITLILNNRLTDFTDYELRALNPKGESTQSKCIKYFYNRWK